MGTIMETDLVYQRVLLKLSGEALKGTQPYGIDPGTTAALARRLVAIRDTGIELALVIGAGNIFRGLGASRNGMGRVTADHMGMLATVMNSLALQNALEQAGAETVVQSAIPMPQVAETFVARHAVTHLRQGRIVIFAAGTGNPFFTTDTTAALRANEIGAEAILKATKVDGVYSADPETNPDAKRYVSISYRDALAQQLKVMDSTAFSLCQDNEIPIIVFNFNEEHALGEILRGDLSHATLVSSAG